MHDVGNNVKNLTLLSVLPAMALLTASALPSLAETRGLIVGVDKYPHLSPVLRGAVNDARDISGVLRERGVSDLQVLLDGQATRKNILAAIDGLMERVAPGDLVFFTFSGHGVRETWSDSRPVGIKKGSQREVFLLYNAVLPDAKGMIDPSAGGDASDRLLDAEINVMLRKLEEKGARVLFVADACHGGGATRSVLMEKELIPPTYRVVSGRPYASGQDPLEDLYRQLPQPIDTDELLPNLTFLGAVDQLHKVPEVEIPTGSKVMRGALSYALARMLDGTAPVAPGGKVTRGALFDYLNATIRTNTANRQDPDLRPRKEFDKVVVDMEGDFPTPGKPSPQSAETTVHIRAINGVIEAPVVSAGAPFQIALTQSLAEADIVYDVSQAAVLTINGDLIAKTDDAGALVGIAEREYALRKLLSHSLSRPRNLRLDKGDKRYVQGERISLDARRTPPDPNEQVHYLLFNIAGNGTVQFLYPKDERDPLILAQDRMFDEMKVTPPFGTDMAVFVASQEPLTEAIEKIRDMDGKIAPLRAVEILERSIPADATVGLQGFYSSETAE